MALPPPLDSGGEGKQRVGAQSNGGGSSEPRGGGREARRPVRDNKRGDHVALWTKQSGAQVPPRRDPPLSPDFPRPPVPPGLAQRGSASGTRAKRTVPSPRADGNVCLVTRPNGRRWVERAGRKDDRYGKGPEVQMNPASTPRCPYRPLPRVKEEERARAPVFHRSRDNSMPWRPPTSM